MNHPTDTSIYAPHGTPPARQLVPLGLQHVVAAVAGMMTPAILVASACGLTPEESTLLIQVSLILSALATLLQLFPMGGQIGSGLPVIMGCSFAYLPTLQAIGISFGLPAI